MKKKTALDNFVDDQSLMDQAQDAPPTDKDGNEIGAMEIAYEHTYGKGYNPAAMEQLYKALTKIWNEAQKETMALGETRFRKSIIEICETALQNSKL